MNIKDFFAQKENAVGELYWALVIEASRVQACAWTIKENKTEIISVSPSSAWGDDTELVNAVDTALSSCIQNLPEKSEGPKKTVFGVLSSWTTEGEIKPEYLAKIKKLCSDLSLEPSGFVVLPEAISHYYKYLEGAPLNAIVVGLGEQELEISVFKIGNLVGTTQVARSVSVVDDVVEGLTRFEGASPLPSRIILYDGKGGELDEARNSLAGNVWEESEKVKFLHTPKVEALEVDKKVEATALAGATEIGGITEIDLKEKEEDVVPVSEPEELKDLGFTVTEVEKPSQAGVVVSESTPSVPKKNYLKGLSGYFKSLWLKFSAKQTLLLGSVGLFILGSILFWWFYPKAEVTIYVAPKSFEEEFEMTFSSEKLIETEVSGDKTQNTSGLKLVGDRAKGSVQIRNGTSLPISLTAGTALFSASNLKFLLDNSASVSAAISPGSPGMATVQITAQDIGSEYNLAKDEVFKVSNYPKAEVDGVATTNLSGGSSREIAAVSENDRSKLREDLELELLEKAKQEFAGRSGADLIFLDDLALFEEVEALYNHKVGDEADNIKLSLSMKALGVLIDKKMLADSVREKISDKVPDGFVLRDTQIKYEFSFDSENSDGEFVYLVTAKVNFLPEINQEEIIKSIAGRLPSVVETYLSKIPGFSRAEIRISPLFPGRFGTLPRVKKNITIDVASER